MQGVLRLNEAEIVASPTPPSSLCPIGEHLVFMGKTEKRSMNGAETSD